MDNRSEKGLVRLECETVAAVVGKNYDGPRSHGWVAAGAASSLKELRRIAWSLVLQDCADGRIVKSDLERCGRDDDVSV